METKCCTRCGAEKPLDEFAPNKQRVSGYGAQCIPCRREASRESARKHRSEHKERLKAYMKDYNAKEYLTARGRAKKLIQGAKCRKKYGVDLDVDWLAEKIEAGRCEVTGIPFDLSPIEGRSRNARAPSLDRIDTNADYTKDNVQVVLFAYNMLKGEMGAQEANDLLLEMAEGLRD